MKEEKERKPFIPPKNWEWGEFPDAAIGELPEVSEEELKRLHRNFKKDLERIKREIRKKLEKIWQEKVEA